MQVPRAKKKMSVGMMFGLIVGFVALGVVVIIVLVAHGIREKRKTPEQREIEALAKQFPTVQMTAFLAVRQAIREGREPGEILAGVKAFQTNYPESSALLDKVRGLATPYVEQELQTLRQARHSEELKGWQARGKELQEQERKAQEELAKQQREADEAARKQQEDRKRQQREQALAQLRQQQDSLRAQAADLGRKLRFAEARRLFVGMSQSREEEFRTWAQAEQRCFELAEKLFSAVANAKDAIKGFKTALPTRRGKWSVAAITNKEVTFETNEIDVKTGDTVKRTVPIQIGDLHPGLFAELALYVGRKAGTSDDELNLMLGAYFLAHGNFFHLREARARLAACSTQADSAVLLKELEVLEPLLKEKQFAEQVDRAKLMANKGDTKGAAVLAKYLKDQFPEQYQKVESEIEQLLQGN
jgi:hypothetical protein